MLAGTETLADKGLVLVVAGLPHNGPRSSDAERAAAAGRVMTVLRAAGLHADHVGAGFSRAEAFSPG